MSSMEANWGDLKEGAIKAVQAATDQVAQLDQAQLMDMAKKMKDKATKHTVENVEMAKAAAAQVARSQSTEEALQNVAKLIRVVDSGPVAKYVAHVLVCLYFLNMVYEEVETWLHLRDPEVQAGMRRRPMDPIEVPVFPLFTVGLLLPSAILTALSIKPQWFGWVLLGFLLQQDAWLMWMQIRNILFYGGRPTELVVKRLAMIGSCLLLLARAYNTTPRAFLSSYAGPLRGPDSEHKTPTVGKRKSLALLVSRLLLATLYLYFGWTQYQRVAARNHMLSSSPKAGHHHHWGIQDSHDNNWLLLECLLALPLAIGFKTLFVTRMLSLVLILEAVTCWPFWWGPWPSWHYAAHVRLHFFVNFASAGGLLLLQGFGIGVYTLDELLSKKSK